MLDERRGVFFAHIPKTGGTSIEFAHGFENAAGVKLRHQNDGQLERYLESQDQPPSITLRIVVVRNVVDQLVSTYRHRHWSLDKSGITSTLSFEDYVRAMSDYHQGADLRRHGPYVYRSETDMRASGEFLLDQRHIERFDWWVGAARRDYVVLRFETLGEDYMAKVAPITGVRDMPHRNPTPRRFKKLRADVSATARRMIERCYADEINSFSMAV